jgi:hypothetical protein
MINNNNKKGVKNKNKFCFFRFIFRQLSMPNVYIKYKNKKRDHINSHLSLELKWCLNRVKKKKIKLKSSQLLSSSFN